MAKLRALLGALALMLAFAAPAGAQGLTTVSSQALTPRVTEYVVNSPALNGASSLRVILPAGYAENPTRRYPVLYLLHGAFDDYRSWVDKGGAEAATEPYPMIVVMPNGGTFGWYANHYNNGPRWEDFHIRELIPWVDATFRTKPERSERAIAGLSMGGGGTAAYAGRHPDLFAALAPFSGVVNPILLGPGENVHGPKATEIARWQGSDGTYLTPNYRTMAHIAVRTGNGTPGDLDTPGRPPDGLEAALHTQNVNLHDRLTGLGIPHVWQTANGTHTWPYWERYLRQTLPEFQQVFDGDVPTPAKVNFRLPDNRWSAWGWTVQFDAARPYDWTHLENADATGFSLTGKGLATVTTPAAYPPGKAYKANGTPVTADAEGRLTFGVDLGAERSTVQVFIGALSTETPGTVGGSVPATLSLTLGAPASFGAFAPGVAKEYTASTTATVVSSAGDATLTVSDPSATAPGHLVNGAFSLPQPLQGLGVVKTYAGPVSNDAATVTFKQAIGASDALRTGAYSKTLTFTLSTTAP
jgi:S-formylglutathione hydrolase FrmB